MVALSPDSQSKCRFHLGYNYSTPPADYARLDNAMNNVIDAWTANRIDTILIRCEASFADTEVDQGQMLDSAQQVISGDITRTTTERARDSYNLKYRDYANECRSLALALGVRNYRDTEQALDGYWKNGGYTINTISGPEGTSAYQSAINNGFIGTEQEWLDSLGVGTASIVFPFSWGDATPVAIASLKNTDLLIRVVVSIDIAFDVAGSTIRVYGSSDYMATTQNLPDSLGVYSTSPSHLATGTEILYLEISSAVGTAAGSGTVFLHVS